MEGHERCMLVAAVDQSTGAVLGQTQVGSKTNEIPALRQLASELDLQGCIVTADALHAQQETARTLLEDCHADYLFTAIKDNQPTILDDLRGLSFKGCPSNETEEKAHGRIDRRTCHVKDISDPQWDGTASLHGRRLAIRIERERHIVRTGKTSIRTTYALSSLDPGCVTAGQVAALVRGHWSIENGIHFVRDFSYDEDRCRVWVGDLPRNLAALTNAAISIVRCRTRFPFVPPANRHYAAHPGKALDLVLRPPAD